MHRAKTRTGRKPAPGENLHRAKSCIVQVFAGKKIQNRPENIKIAPTPDSRGRKRQAKTGTGRKSENRGNSRADRGQYRNARTTQAEREREERTVLGRGRGEAALRTCSIKNPLCLRLAPSVLPCSRVLRAAWVPLTRIIIKWMLQGAWLPLT